MSLTSEKISSVYLSLSSVYDVFTSFLQGVLHSTYTQVLRNMVGHITDLRESLMLNFLPMVDFLLLGLMKVW